MAYFKKERVLVKQVYAQLEEPEVWTMHYYNGNDEVKVALFS